MPPLEKDILATPRYLIYSMGDSGSVLGSSDTVLLRPDTSV